MIPLLGPCILAALLATATPERFDPWTHTARYELDYRVDLSTLDASDAERVRVWIPTPGESEYQHVLSARIDATHPYLQTHDDVENHFVYFEYDPRKAGGGVVSLHFVVERAPFTTPRLAKIQAGSALDPARYLHAQKRIPLDGMIRKAADQASSGLTNDGKKIRAFYDYVIRTMRYSKHGEGWGKGDAIWACSAKYGNCTDFHSLFMGMARSQNIAARFLIGFPMGADQAAGTVDGYHCWAEVFDPERGWIPLDASEAWKAKRFDDYFGRLPSDRVAFTVGRDLTLNPPQADQPLNFFVYPYVEIDGKPVEQVAWTLSYKRTSFRSARN